MLEFALLASVLMAMLLGGLELGLMMWTQGTLQSVAARTARCAAIGSAACPNPQQYAVNLATAWLGAGMITTGNVTVTSVTTCGTASGTFEQVTIHASGWVGAILFPLNAQTETTTACYPT